MAWVIGAIIVAVCYTLIDVGTFSVAVGEFHWRYFREDFWNWYGFIRNQTMRWSFFAPALVVHLWLPLFAFGVVIAQLSLAVVGALAAPFAFCTYKAHPTYSVWVPVTAQLKRELAASLHRSDYCRRESGSFVMDFMCEQDKRKLQQGGEYQYHPDDLRYFELNAGVAAATFVSVFGLTLLIPMLVRGFAFLIRSYWIWLNA